MRLIPFIPIVVGLAVVGWFYWALATSRIVPVTDEQAEFASDVLVDIENLP